MSYLLDTDICIYWLKGRESVLSKVDDIGLNNIFISMITAAELFYGAYNSQSVEKNLMTAKRFIDFFDVLDLSLEASEIFGRLKAELRQQGNLIADMDLMIASVALANNLVLVTNNTRHYARIEALHLENWINV
jgi:tRNA(fMet)-specific endonuclease VapC